MSRKVHSVIKRGNSTPFSAQWDYRVPAPQELPLDWCGLFQTYPTEYFKAIQGENHQRDASGWRTNGKRQEKNMPQNIEENLNIRTRMKIRLKARLRERRIFEYRPLFTWTSAETFEELKKSDELSVDAKPNVSYGPLEVPKEKKRKKAGRPVAGTPEAKKQTAAACEANRRRHAREAGTVKGQDIMVIERLDESIEKRNV
jgi:hypothetical protein